MVGFLVGLISLVVTNGAVATPDLDRFDPDIYPAIDVSHNPPVIARADENVRLAFTFACGFALPNQQRCLPSATLFTAYGDSQFTPVALAEENHDSLRVLAATVPAADASGQPLRYYLDVTEATTSVQGRHPAVGAIEPLVAADLTPVRLGASTAATAESYLHLGWGTAPSQVGVERHVEQATMAPDSFDVAPNGTIALLDHINQRVVVTNPARGSFHTFGAPLKGVGDVAIDADGTITVLDLVGERTGESKARVPQVHRFDAQGKKLGSATVYASRPTGLTASRSVNDLLDNREVQALKADARAATREEQRQSRSRAAYLVKFLDANHARLADTQRNLTFDVTSSETLGAIAYFGRTAQGYVAVFEDTSLRVVWFDAKGTVIKDVLAPNQQASTFNPNGRVAVDQQGNVYILGSTDTGIEVSRVAAR
ncbi:MAG TPA: hypothetical protein VFZ66_20530 [Herpetosiphonaceae bacterium]